MDLLQVRKTMSLGPAKDDQGIGSHPDLRKFLHRIPKQVAGHEDIGVVGKEVIKAAFDLDDPFELQGILGHRQAVGVGVDDRAGTSDRGDHGSHGEKSLATATGIDQMAAAFLDIDEAGIYL